MECVCASCWTIVSARHVLASIAAGEGASSHAIVCYTLLMETFVAARYTVANYYETEGW